MNAKLGEGGQARVEVGESQGEVERISAPNAEEFLRRYRRPGRPVIIEGALDHTVALKEWSFELFRERYGDHRLPVARVHQHRLDLRNTENVDYDDGQLFSEFLARLEELEAAHKSPEGYVMFHPKDGHPELLEELPLPDFVPSAPWSIAKLWLSGGDTRTPLHMDLPDNVFAQIFGRKLITLFSPANEPWMYRNSLRSAMPQVSRVDAEEPDLDRFPLFSRARPMRCVVGPGDLLYIPRFWWHQVRSLERSISVNYWWATGLNLLLVRAALFYQSRRKLRY